MKKYLALSFFIMLFVGLGHLISRQEAYYGTYWYADILLHVTAGVAMGVFWLALAGKPAKKTDYAAIVLFAVFGSYLWELWEFSGLKVIPDKLIYKPTLPDSLGDIVAGMGGGAIVALFLKLRK
mgnify:CR=1 FL=1